jgi:tetratricopeptide (TPR) repeat protein
MASFVLNIQLQGGISPSQLRLTNVAIHISTSVLVFFFTRLLIRATSHGEKAQAIALVTSVIWLLSPVNVNVVLYVVQRMAMLATFFTVAGLFLYTAGRLEDRRRIRWLCFIGCGVVCLPLAILSKESGILLIPLVFLVEIYVLHPARPWFTGRQLTIAVAVGVISAVVIAIQFAPNALDYTNRDFTLEERLLSQPRALVSYIWHLLIPMGADAGIYTDGFAVSTGLLSPISTSGAILVCLTGIAVPVFLINRPLALAGFGVAFFFVGHAIESTFIPLEMYFLHRNYLAGIGIYLALAALLVQCVPDRRFTGVAIAIYCVYFSMIDYARSHTWSSRENLAMDAVKYNPQSARAWSRFAQLATEGRQYELAENAIDRSIALSGTPNSIAQKLYVLCSAGKRISSEHYAALHQSPGLGLSNELSQAQANLLQLFETGDCPQLSIPELVDSMDRLSARLTQSGRDPWTVEFYADAFLHAAGEKKAAHERLQRRLDDGHLESGMYRIELLLEEHAYEQARKVLDQILHESDEAFRDKFDEMLREFERLIRSG